MTCGNPIQLTNQVQLKPFQSILLVVMVGILFDSIKLDCHWLDVQSRGELNKHNWLIFDDYNLLHSKGSWSWFLKAISMFVRLKSGCWMLRYLSTNSIVEHAMERSIHGNPSPWVIKKMSLRSLNFHYR